MDYTKQDKKILKEREVEEAEENPMIPEDMPEEQDIDVLVERSADGNICIKVMKDSKSKK